jgi:hypothetical protein
MIESSLAGIIGAAAGVFTAFGGLIVAVTLLLPVLRNTRKNITKIDEVHTMVNQQRTDSQRYQVALIQVLKQHGISVPVDQSLPVPESLPEPLYIEEQTP